jgi:16S rRNA processing protein RimM
MMNMSDFFYLGKVVKTHGIHGELSGFVDADDPLFYSQTHSIFVKTKQGLIPYSVDKISIDTKGYFIVKFKEVDGIVNAKKFINKELFLPMTMLPKLTGNQFYFHEIIGFQVSDIHHGNIGFVNGVLEHTVQPLLQVIHEDNEILIPIHDHIIIAVDRENKIITVDMPSGLLDIYLEA